MSNYFHLTMYKCVTCSLNFSSLTDYNKHHLDHRNLLNFKAACRVSNCPKEFDSYFNFRKHINRFHKLNTVSQIYTNYLCKQESCHFQCANLISFKKHLMKYFQEGESLLCPLPNCSNRRKVFSNKNSFFLHFFTFHQNEKRNFDKDISEKNAKVNLASDYKDFSDLERAVSDDSEDESQDENQDESQDEDSESENDNFDIIIKEKENVNSTNV